MAAAKLDTAKNPVVITPSKVRAAVKEILRINAELETRKELYHQRDEAMKLLIPFFVKKRSGKFIIRTKMTVGKNTVVFNPAFFDEKKDLAKIQGWKASAQNYFEVSII